MCEPNHSIVQFPNQDDQGNPTESRLDSIPSEQGWGAWLKKKIGSYFHFSKMGLGHSETLGTISPVGRRLLIQDTKYEAQWWDRKFHLDGTFHGPEYDKKEAFDCAHEYAKRVSIGNLTTLRQFLENSIMKTFQLSRYLELFAGSFLNREGSNEFLVKMKTKLYWQDLWNIPFNLDKEERRKLLKMMLGFTRRRNLLVPEWADDTKLWTPG